MTGQGAISTMRLPGLAHTVFVRSPPVRRSPGHERRRRKFSDHPEAVVVVLWVLAQGLGTRTEREGLPAHLTRHLVTIAKVNRAGRYDRDLLVREYGLVTVMQARVGLRAHLDGQEMSGDSRTSQMSGSRAERLGRWWPGSGVGRARRRRGEQQEGSLDRSATTARPAQGRSRARLPPDALPGRRADQPLRWRDGGAAVHAQSRAYVQTHTAGAKETLDDPDLPSLLTEVLVEALKRAGTRPVTLTTKGIRYDAKRTMTDTMGRPRPACDQPLGETPGWTELVRLER